MTTVGNVIKTFYRCNYATNGITSAKIYFINILHTYLKTVGKYTIVLFGKKLCVMQPEAACNVRTRTAYFAGVMRLK
jgi:hypothetical protein